MTTDGRRTKDDRERAKGERRTRRRIHRPSSFVVRRSSSVPRPCSAAIVGWGKCLPSRVLSNAELGRLVQTDDEWIRSRTGIAERRIAGDDETVASLGAEAARQALAVADVPAADVDLLILTTNTPDLVIPPTSCLIQHAIGATDAAAFDQIVGCAGFLYALVTASQFIESGAYRNVLVVGADVMSRVVDWSDRNTCVLFGDGAGAVLLQAGERTSRPMGFVLGADGSGAQQIVVSELGTLPRNGASGGRAYRLAMNGYEVFRFAVSAIAQSVRQAAGRAGLALDEVDLIVPHQANYRIIAAAARLLGLSLDRFYLNLDRYGNTGSATIPLALCEAIEDGRLHPGDNLVLAGCGAGVTWGGLALEWTAETASHVRRRTELATVGARD